MSMYDDTVDVTPEGVREGAVLSGMFGESAPVETERGIETITEEIIFYKNVGGQAVIEIGRRLTEAKAQLKHGEWLPWLREKVEFSETSAQNFMRIAREYGNTHLVGDLGASKALVLLALPASERENFAQEKHVVNGEEKSVSEMSKRELEEAIRFAQQKLEHHRLMAHELARQTDTTQTLGELPGQQGKSQPVRQVMAYVEEHYPEKITIGIMAQKFHYSETLLIRRFKSETGINFSEYLTHFRLQKATAMMRETDRSISQIAEACGFSEYRYFRGVFQKKIGCSPTQYAQDVRLMRNDGNGV